MDTSPTQEDCCENLLGLEAAQDLARFLLKIAFFRGRQDQHDRHSPQEMAFLHLCGLWILSSIPLGSDPGSILQFLGEAGEERPPASDRRGGLLKEMPRSRYLWFSRKEIYEPKAGH